MWQRFTERARKVVFYAQEEAQRFGEGYVSTEHLLLGLVREPGCCGALLLTQSGVSLERVRSEVEKQLPRGDNGPSQDMTLTPRAKRVIDLAYDEARGLNHNYIGSEHLLLGLVREADGLAGRVLDKLGVDLQALRDIRAKLNPGPEPEGSDPREVALGNLGFSGLRLTTELTESIIRAALEAKRRGVPESEPDDVLIAILAQSKSVGHQVLLNLDADPMLISEQLMSRLGQAERPFQGEIQPAASTVKLVQEADDFREFLGHRRIGTHHVLHAVLHQSVGIGCELLQEHGVDEHRVVAAIRDLGPEEPDRPMRKAKPHRPSFGQAFAPERLLLLIIGEPPQELLDALRDVKASPLMVSDSLINFFPQPPMNRDGPTLDAILAKANELREVHNHPQSTTTHLVAAILELGDSFASDTLSAMGLTANDLLSRIRQ